MVKQHGVYAIMSILAVTIALSACESGAATPPPTPLTFAQTPGAAPMVGTPATSAPIATAQGYATQPYQPIILMPPGLKLSGKLIFADYRVGIVRFEFSTRKIVPIYQLPPYSFVNSVMLSPDGRTLLMAYGPPPDPNNPQYVASGVYTLFTDGSGEPSLLLADDANGDFYFSPRWSPDGQYIYTGHFVSPPLQGTPATKPFGYYLIRYALPQGPAQDIHTGALAAGSSADGKQIFYVSINVDTMLSNLYSADPDGANARSLLPGGENWIIDSLAVAPDGKSIVFSNANTGPAQSSLPWFDQLMGVQVAEAHSLPADLWIVQVGEKPRQLTHLADYGFVEDFSPDGQYIVFSCSSGVFIMRPDGSGQTQIISEPVYGSIQWVP
jgi:dipeptidyl aminopeptidase/acylaminoacyl peptidase